MKRYLTSKSLTSLLRSDCKMVVSEISEADFWRLADTAISTAEVPLDSPAEILYYKFEADVVNKAFISQFFLIEFKPKQMTMKVAPRMNVSRAGKPSFTAGRPVNKFELREKAKRHPNYYLKIDNGGVEGQTDTGDAIPIDTLGKWVFGTPGYRGHIIVMEGSETGEIYLPKDAPREAYDMIADCLQA